MALIGFSVLRDKLESHEKCQTIRKPRKHPFKIGERVHIYWHLRQKDCTKLGEGIITNVVRKKAHQFTEEDAIKDGFTRKENPPTLQREPIFQLLGTLQNLHKGANGDTEFDIVTWRWLPQSVPFPRREKS